MAYMPYRAYKFGGAMGPDSFPVPKCFFEWKGALGAFVKSL